MSRASGQHGVRPKRRRTRRTILLMCSRCYIWTRHVLVDAVAASDGRHKYLCRGCDNEVRR